MIIKGGWVYADYQFKKKLCLVLDLATSNGLRVALLAGYGNRGNRMWVPLTFMQSEDLAVEQAGNKYLRWILNSVQKNPDEGS